MSKKIEGDTKIIVDLVNDRINDVLERNIDFEKRAEKKLDDTRDIVRNEISVVHKRLDKIENRQEDMIKTQFEIDELKKDVKNIKVELKVDIKNTNDKIDSHLKDHNKKLPKQAVDSYKTKILMAVVFSGIGFTLLTFIIIKILEAI